MAETRTAPSKRLTRHEIQEPDAFLHGMEGTVRYIRQHQAQVLGLGLGALVTMVGLIFGVSWWSSREGKANMALSSLLEVEARPVKGAPESRDPGSKQEPFSDQAAKDNALIQEADTYLGAHGSARAARGAKLVKAQALYRRGRFADATPLFSEVAGSSPSDALGVSAAFALATAKAAAGQNDEAVTQLTRLAASGSPFVPKDLALKLAASICEQKGDLDQAVKLYQRVADETPASPLAGEAKAKVLELNGALSSTSGTAAAAGASPSPR